MPLSVLTIQTSKLLGVFITHSKTCYLLEVPASNWYKSFPSKAH